VNWHFLVLLGEKTLATTVLQFGQMEFESAEGATSQQLQKVISHAGSVLEMKKNNVEVP
jgi:hypothetical protein